MASSVVVPAESDLAGRRENKALAIRKEFLQGRPKSLHREFQPKPLKQ